MTAARAVRLPAAGVATGNPITVCEVGGHRVGVIRISGELHAVADRCPHRGAPICTHGELVADVSSYEPGARNGEPAEARMLRCPWHKWDYDPVTGICPAAPKFRLRRYHVWDDGDDIIVSLDPRPDPGGSPPSA